MYMSCEIRNMDIEEVETCTAMAKTVKVNFLPILGHINTSLNVVVSMSNN
jgi:hypothetical protein